MKDDVTTHLMARELLFTLDAIHVFFQEQLGDLRKYARQVMADVGESMDSSAEKRMALRQALDKAIEAKKSLREVRSHLVWWLENQNPVTWWCGGDEVTPQSAGESRITR